MKIFFLFIYENTDLFKIKFFCRTLKKIQSMILYAEKFRIACSVNETYKKNLLLTRIWKTLDLL